MAPDFTDMFLDKVGAFIDVVEEKTFYIDIEMKRRVRDAEYWGAPVGTLIVPGMKPRGTRTVKAPSAAKPRAKKKATVAKKKTTAKRTAAKKATTARAKPVDVTPEESESRKVTKARIKKIVGAVALGAAGGTARETVGKLGARVMEEFDIDKLIGMIPTFGIEEPSTTSRVTPEMTDRFKKMRSRVAKISDSYNVAEMDKAFEQLRNANNPDSAMDAVFQMADILEGAGDGTQRGNHDALADMVAESWKEPSAPAKPSSSSTVGNIDKAYDRLESALMMIGGSASGFTIEDGLGGPPRLRAELDNGDIFTLEFDKNANTFSTYLSNSRGRRLAQGEKDRDVASLTKIGIGKLLAGVLDAPRIASSRGRNTPSKKYEDVDLETTDYIKSDSFYEDVEMKKRVRDADYWGQPVGTLITPGMKPKGKKPKVGTVAKKTPAKKRALKKRIVPKKRAAAPKATGADAPKKPAAKKTTAKRATAKKPSPSTPSNSGPSKLRWVVVGSPDSKNKKSKEYFDSEEEARAHFAKVRGGGQKFGVRQANQRTEGAEAYVKPKEGPDTSVRKADDFSVKDAASVLGEISVEGTSDGAGTVDDPIDCGDNITKAHKLLGEGKHIRLNTPMQVSLLMDRLAEEADFAKERGEETPDYDLCKVTVPKTNLFCLESKGIPRAKMPQFSGTPVEGSYADASMKRAQKEAQRRIDAGETRDDGKAIKVPDEANITADFAALLDEMGISVEETTVPAQELKATQSQLVGTKVAGMRRAMKAGKVAEEAIYVTRDGYIVDGHHRWAAKIGLGLEGGDDADQIMMPVYIIDAEIGYILDLSNGFAEMAGIKAKSTGAAADGVKSLWGIEQVWNPCVGCEAHVY